MGGGCEHGSEHGRRLWRVPPPRNYSADQGGRHSSKFDGGLKSKHGSEGSMGGALKCFQIITVKEFDSKVAGYYKPASLQIY